MRKVLIVAMASLGLMASACTKATQEKTSEDVKAAGAKTGDALKDVAASPEMKSVGTDIKNAAHETADAAKVATKDLATDIKKTAHDTNQKVKEEAAEAKK